MSSKSGTRTGAGPLMGSSGSTPSARSATCSPMLAGRQNDLLDTDCNGMLDYKELNKELRRGASVELDAALQDGALGEIETKSKNKHSLWKDVTSLTTDRLQHSRLSTVTKPLRHCRFVTTAADVRKGTRVRHILNARMVLMLASPPGQKLETTRKGYGRVSVWMRR